MPDFDGYNVLKSQAEVLLAILNLCSELHALSFGDAYRNAGEWWRECAREFQCARRSDYYFGTDYLEGKASKSQIVRMLQKGQNPFTDKEMSILSNLIQLVIVHKESLKTIYDDLLIGRQRQKPHKGLSVAFSAWETTKMRDLTIAIAFDTKSGQIATDYNGNLVTNGKNGISGLEFTD